MSELLPYWRRVNWRGAFALDSLLVVAVAGYVITLMAINGVTHGSF